MSKTPTTKIDQVAHHLIRKKSITSWDAIQLYRATRLADIVFKLKCHGWDISSTLRFEPDGTRYAVYRLVSYPKGGAHA